MQNPEIAPEMRLFSPDGERLYLTSEERRRFLDASALESPSERMFCHVLHYTGCRPSEALAITPRRVMINDSNIVIQSLKKHKTDQQGRLKQAQYRSVPVPPSLIEHLDLVFGLRSQLRRDFGIDAQLWSMSRPTAYRLVKRVMDRAGIVGAQATGKGLRHGFGVALVTANPPVPLHVISQLMGHSDSKTTEIYLQVLSEERHSLVMNAWA
ncbi:site-specific integrase [Shewanella sp. NKUCC06_TVS]|uniref:tyrosine-type recombinase/integrase n=1 Tax=Shewanella sp. NKUCC06_TVS TaxID=2842128 RepID=UPI001C5AB543|nr:site-specific integrase [Shewanella sp. NKUCC06_TVS]MBW3533436.1 site-specific integrase [Shewanella sp. NKUCC06_TVS]